MKLYRVAVIVVFLCAATPPVCGQRAPSRPTPTPRATPQAHPSPAAAPVTISGKTLFSVRRLLSLPASERADAIQGRIERLARDASISSSSFEVVESETTTDIVAQDLIVMSVTDADAAGTGKSRKELAREYAAAIGAEVESLRRTHSLKSILLGALWAFLTTVAFWLALRGLREIFKRAYARLDSWRGTRIRSLKIQRFELLPADRITDFLIGTAKLIRATVTVLAGYLYISFVLDSFPWTRGYAAVLFRNVMTPVRIVGRAVLSYLPNVFFIAVILIVAFYISRFVRMIFREIGKGTIELPGFYREWADPTYKIARFMIIALTVVVVFPYLPGARSPAFQGVSIFLGVLFSLGSTSAVANVVAGVILTYMRAFKIGDRVKIADTVGDVTDKTLLVTRVRTIKNVDVTIANSIILGAHIINFSASAKDRGLIVHTAVTIGYNAPWRKVHELLLHAAGATQHILKEPKPFVLQTALDDFYVRYELNAYTDNPSAMAQIYSDLHQNIQDSFNEGGVEIMSPHYSSLRDGNRMTIPEEYLPASYRAPKFGIESESGSRSYGTSKAGSAGARQEDE